MFYFFFKKRCQNRRDITNKWFAATVTTFAINMLQQLLLYCLIDERLNDSIQNVFFTLEFRTVHLPSRTRLIID